MTFNLLASASGDTAAAAVLLPPGFEPVVKAFAPISRVILAAAQASIYATFNANISGSEATAGAADESATELRKMLSFSCEGDVFDAVNRTQLTAEMEAPEPATVLTAVNAAAATVLGQHHQQYHHQQEQQQQ